MAGKRRRSNSRADDGAAGEHEDEDAAAPVGPTASVSEVQQQDFQPNPSQHKERAIPQYGGPQANAAAASQINPGDAGSLGRAPLIRNDHLDPRGPAERQTSGDTGEGANHADHPFANGFPGATVTNSESPNIAEISIAAGAAGPGCLSSISTMVLGSFASSTTRCMPMAGLHSGSPAFHF